ncbi:MAG: 16S rRNA (guanine(966)-N(2))-methyltransferase RsmD [Gammaproteobacteria bacterium]|nr:16S rRNA (guanine(966)-N(2))-methyltransferase RsmD [Gammaproteobacteria bacterium]MCW8923909.1 16S rRNA (guanine(966)-N(2))-methyltransferase RsmD [Gammaproteobacteria bacterium]
MSKPERGQLRIIAGSWRGRKLKFLDREGLRPTTDRVRETMFNWLQMALPGSRCLDLFAGSGALGFEAASRGASKVVMVDSDRETVNMLKAGIDLLSASQVQAVCSEAIAFLSNCDQSYDIVFIDPPYSVDVIARCCELLESRQCLSDHAKIVIECAAGKELKGLPDNWQCVRSKTAGQAGYHLFSREMVA